MPKKLTAQEFENIISGGEPSFQKEPITKIFLIQCLNWYTANRETKNAQKYINDYLSKNKIHSTQEKIGTMPNTFGWLCRMISRGAILTEDQQKYFDAKIDFLKTKKVKEVIVEKNWNQPSVRERVEEKARECIGELEGCIDEFYHSNFKEKKSPLGLMLDNNIKGMHCAYILDVFKNRRDELESVLSTKDEQIIEGYSNIKKAGIKKIVEYIQLIIDDTQKVIGESQKTRKPRKRKVKTAAQLTSKVKYCAEDKKLNIKSVNPDKIIGGSALWIFNTKTRKLGCYYADDASGLSVKGTSILNYSKSKSIAKTIRKPEELVGKVATGGKVFLRNVLGNVKAKEIKLNGRINSDTVLLLVMN